MDSISVVGLGKLGCSMAACFAYKGWNVIGVDKLNDIVRKINNGESPICEPQVQNLIIRNRSRLRATMNMVDAILNTDSTFIVVPTPSLPNGDFSTHFVEDAVKSIAKALKIKKSYHLIVITSTILPGKTLEMEKIIEAMSEKKCGSEFGLCYNPDFIAIGQIVHDFLNPDMVLIGESDPSSGLKLQEIHEKLVNNNPEFYRMDYHNAELAKIALNSFCTMKITFANTIAKICESMPHGDSEKVLAAIGADSRVGKKYLKGGLGYAGPCFPRDNRAFAHTAAKYKTKALLADTTDSLNRYFLKTRPTHMLSSILKERGISKIAFLGLTYKKNTHLIENSAAFNTAIGLAKQGFEVTAYDPMGIEEAKKLLKGKNREKIIFADSVIHCLSKQKICFVGTPWDEFRLLKQNDFIFYMDKDPIIIDAWNLYSFTKPELIKIGKNR